MQRCNYIARFLYPTSSPIAATTTITMRNLRSSSLAQLKQRQDREINRSMTRGQNNSEAAGSPHHEPSETMMLPHTGDEYKTTLAYSNTQRARLFGSTMDHHPKDQSDSTTQQKLEEHLKRLGEGLFFLLYLLPWH